jgi:hypothetical protein
MSGAQDMLPTTKGEKRRSVKEATSKKEALDPDGEPTAQQPAKPLGNEGGGNGLPLPGSGQQVPIDTNMHDRRMPLISR